MENIKNSFVLYNDYKDTTDELSDEEAGKLFKMILAKVNGEEYEIEDRTLRLVFKPIEKALERDLRKYENKLQEKSNAGKIGNLKRWNPDLYDDFQKGKIDINEALKIAEDRKASHRDNSIANIADNGSGNESDSVIEIENKSDDEVDENKEINLNANGRYFLNNQNSNLIKKAFMQEFRIKDENKLIEKLKAFNRHCVKYNKMKKSPKDYREHFNHWLTKEKKDKAAGIGSAPERFPTASRKGML